MPDPVQQRSAGGGWYMMARFQAPVEVLEGLFHLGTHVTLPHAVAIDVAS